MNTTAFQAAKKIVANPHGYTEDSVLVAQAFLEAERVPEGWKLVFAPFDCHGTRICPFCRCRTNANAMACCNRAAKESILAAPQQPKKE